MDDYHPTTLYGQSKVMAEKIIKNANNLNFDIVIIRPTSIWGLWFDAPYLQYFRAIKNRIFFKFGHRMATKTFGFVGNSISQINLEGEDHVFYEQDEDDINEMEEFHNQKINFKSLEIEEIDSLAMFNSWLDSQDSIDYLKTQWMDMVLLSPLFNHTFFYEMSYDQLNQLTDHKLDDIINKFVKKNTHLNKFDENNYHSDIFEYYKKIS